MKPFEQISIIGVGLLGGSLGLACKSQGLARRVVGYGRSRDNLEKARKLNAIDDYSTDLNDAVKGADLIVLCTPVCSFKALVEKMLPFVKPGTILTDVGSVKAQVVREIESLVPRTINFVGAHPIAGREKSGVSAAEKDLYRGAKCYVTPTSGTDKTALDRVVSLWECLGMKVSAMDVEEHDYIFGAVSHLPHVVAYALMNTIADIKTSKHDQISAFGGNGLKDVTRIAASDPVMWRDICLTNKKSVLLGIGLFQETLNKIKAHIEAGEGDALEQTFPWPTNTVCPCAKKRMIIAIDGPAGSGKSTVARKVAEKLRFRYIETGSMYRAVAWKSMTMGIDLGDREKVADVGRKLGLEFVRAQEGQILLVDGENVSQQLKAETVSRGAAIVATYQEIRDIMTAKQREIGRSGDVVMDGRDIGTIVFPQAEKKFFLDADPEERGKRRYLELKAKNQDVDLTQIIEQVKQRDFEDRNRAIAPLRPAPDAIKVDTTNLKIEEVVDKVVRETGSRADV